MSDLKLNMNQSMAILEGSLRSYFWKWDIISVIHTESFITYFSGYGDFYLDYNNTFWESLSKENVKNSLFSSLTFSIFQDLEFDDLFLLSVLQSVRRMLHVFIANPILC